MQIKNRKKLEQKLNHVFALNMNIIANVLSTSFSDEELEKKYKGMSIDLFAVDRNKNSPVFIEVQKNGMDLVHYKKVVKLVKNIPSGSIIWISSKVNQRFNKELENIVVQSHKNIEIILIEFDGEYLHYLES